MASKKKVTVEPITEDSISISMSALFSVIANTKENNCKDLITAITPFIPSSVWFGKKILYVDSVYGQKYKLTR